MPNSKRNPCSGSINTHGVGKFDNFRRKSPFISEKVRDRPMVTYLDLDLVPPVPDGTLGDEISPPVSIVGSSPCTMPS